MIQAKHVLRVTGDSQRTTCPFEAVSLAAETLVVCNSSSNSSRACLPPLVLTCCGIQHCANLLKLQPAARRLQPGV
jgi:hypothetical protein